MEAHAGVKNGSGSEADGLRPLVAVPCNHCGADDPRRVTVIEADYEFLGFIEDKYARRTFRMVSCSRCGLVYLNPRPDEIDILNYYPSQDYVCFTQFPPRNALMRMLYGVMVKLKRRSVLPLVAPEGTVLDFGCGNGHWLVALKKGAQPTQKFIGIDPCEDPIRKLRVQGIEGHTGDEQLLGTAVPPDSVDVILLIHVIEHVPDPHHTLSRLARVLKPGGEIHGVTPNVDAWDPKVFGQYWAGWHPPRHFILFTREKLEAYARKAGLELVSCRYEMEGATHWAVSLHTLLTRRLWPLAKGQYRLPIYPLLLCYGVLAALLQKVFHKTSIMSFVLRKPR